MKKLSWLLLFLLLAGPVHAAYGDREDDINQLLHYSTYSMTASTHLIFIDISDATNFNLRSLRKEIRFSYIKCVLDKATDAYGTVKLGVVTSVGVSSGTISYFYDAPFKASTGTNIVYEEVYSPSYLKARSSLRDIVTSDIDTDNVAFNNQTSLNTVIGTSAAPAVGDIILTITKDDANSANIVIDALYHSER